MKKNCLLLEIDSTTCTFSYKMWGGMGSLVEVSSNSCEHLFELFWFYGQLNPDNIASSKHICREVSADDFITHAWCT